MDENHLAALAIPVVIALGTAWFSYQQNQTSLQVSGRQHQTDIQIATDQQQEATLKAYLDDISDLLLNHNLRNSKPTDEVRQIARERTLTTLRRLNADHNKLVLQFLQDAQLIGTNNAVIDLSNAYLKGDDLSYVNLKNTDLTGTYLTGAHLSDGHLNGAHLSRIHLSEADLSGTDLSGADLSGADQSRVRVG